ncbi:unnamed protein product [Effrenium voratum]|uniref:Uncharacterized protein n=1 Tax=Effrenium voratum TaxID=2562239 RepID=A0AA36MJC5_9DINO|nr:unnamed protein product [Effrenium voratum]
MSARYRVQSLMEGPDVPSVQGRKEEVTIRAELVNIPGPLCQFLLEPTGILEAQAYAKGMGGAAVPKDKAAVMLRWSAHGAASFWLSCTGSKQGRIAWWMCRNPPKNVAGRSFG